MLMIVSAIAGGALAAFLSYILIEGNDGPNAIAIGLGVAVGFVLPKIFKINGGSQDHSFTPQLSRAQIETALKTLKQVNDIFQKIS